MVPDWSNSLCLLLSGLSRDRKLGAVLGDGKYLCLLKQVFWIRIQVHPMSVARFQSNLNFLVFKRKNKMVSPSQICYEGYTRNIWRQVAGIWYIRNTM